MILLWWSSRCQRSRAVTITSHTLSTCSLLIGAKAAIAALIAARCWGDNPPARPGARSGALSLLSFLSSPPVGSGAVLCCVVSVHLLSLCVWGTPSS
ncbi:MAG TPA: hypothetical protein VGM60_04015, partial [Pseudonocardia sp.]|uniref:hypothetical protein n=1 Tax=Pseudonocardia sp. TaxID=60912 RepID=UPI002F421632